MTIAPIVKTVQVKAAPPRAFDLFVARMGEWWPKGKTIGTAPHTAIVVEPHVGGRWFERDAEGNQTQWGKVLAWEPPGRLLLAWQLTYEWSYDPDLVTEVEITFVPADGGTRVTLTHGNLERFGAEAARQADNLRSGWPTRIDDFAAYADADGRGPEYVVHTVPGSPYARAVMATLYEKGAPFRLAAMATGTLRSETHLSLHPFGRVPVLEHGGFVLYETQAILRYLDRVQPSPSLTPGDPRAAARMDQVMNVNDWYLFQGVANVIGFHRVMGPRLLGLVPDEEAVAATMPKAHIVFEELARLLGDQPYFAGESVSLADLLVAPLLDFLTEAPEWEPLTRDRPALVSWLARMTARPSLQATTWARVAEMAAAA